MKAKILVISGLGLWNYGPRWEVFSRFACSGHEVDYVSPFKEENDEVFTHKVNVPLFERMSGRLLLWFLFMAFSFKKAIEVVKKSRPHVIYGYEVYGAPQAYVLSKIFRTHLISRFQGSILYPRLGKKALIPYMHHVLAFKIPADFLLITDDGTYGNLVARCLKVPESKIRFWMNGVDKDMRPTTNLLTLKEEVGIPKASKVAISVCRLVDWKGTHRLIEAASSIVEKRTDVFFIIVGEGSEKARLKCIAEKLGVSNHIKFIGNVSHRDLPRYLAIADVYVTLQDLSCLSASLLEAMVCGKCIIALNTGETSKVLKNGENGVLLNYSQLEFLPNVLLQLIENDEYRAKLGRKAREFAMKNFWTWDQRANEEIRLVDELVKNRR